ncbi:LysR family transcriptional regulator [Lawsonibacter sp. JLR.KK007]|jgi:molybdate transport repressor ModE-like protein|uniref:LysR family transcriptional regulator n=1 Tax=Lawsonibacter sp. JLR.KK007 TaxID=3114293 RepID=UPI002FEFEF9F
MTQQGIEVFLAVARLGSISAAAQALYITQPAVSRHLKSLEDALGCSLVVRGRGQRRVELTDQGRDFVQVAEKWRLLWQETREVAGQDRAQTLRVASVGSLVSYLLGPRRKEALTRAFLACLDRELNRRPEIESLLSLPDEPIEGGWLCT